MIYLHGVSVTKLYTWTFVGCVCRLALIYFSTVSRHWSCVVCYLGFWLMLGFSCGIWRVDYYNVLAVAFLCFSVCVCGCILWHTWDSRVVVFYSMHENNKITINWSCLCYFYAVICWHLTDGWFVVPSSPSFVPLI